MCGGRQTATVDALGRKVSETAPAPSAGSARPVTRYGYDAVGNRTSVTDPLGNVTVYALDRLNRLVTETDRLGRVSTFVYDAADRQVEERWWASATAAVFHTITRVYGAAQLANVADGERRDGGPPLPVGGLVPGQHGAAFGDATVWAADHGEPFQRKGGPRRVSQHVFETPTIARQVAVDERDPDARVDREHVILPGKHVGGRIGVEELLHAEPPHDATPHPLGERGQMDLGNRPGRQKHWRCAAVCAMCVTVAGRTHAPSRARKRQRWTQGSEPPETALAAQRDSLEKLSEIASDLLPESHAEPARLADELAATVRRGVEPELLVDLWNVVFPEDHDVWFNEVTNELHYESGLVESAD